MKKIREIASEHRYQLLIILLTWGLYFIILFWRMLDIRTDGVYVGHTNVWSDWPLHLGMINIFAHKDPVDWFQYHPLYAGGKFTYPFLTNLISGVLVKFGATLYQAIIIPSIVYALALVIGLYFLYFQMLDSKKKAILALNIFFLASGLGFIGFIRDLVKNPGWSLILNPAVEYSRLDNYHWYTGNFIVGMLVPQRAFLLGLTLAVWALIGFIYIQKKESTEMSASDKAIMIASGLAAGILPIAHTHSFIAVVVITGIICLITIRTYRNWIYFVVPAAGLSALLFLLFIHGGIEKTRFFSVLWGWTSEGGIAGWLFQWQVQWGLIIYVSILTLLWLMWKKRTFTAILFLPFLVLFVLANIFLFQPVRWDNSKIFLWSYLGFSGLAAIGIVELAEGKRFIAKAGAVLIALSLVLTGLIEVIRLQRTDQHSLMLMSRTDMEFAEEIRKKTDPQAVFLTAPAHNHPIMAWAARPVLMGYTAWVDNYGFNYQERLEDIYKMLGGEFEAPSLFKKYSVQYVAIGREEHLYYFANEYYYRNNFPLAFENENYRVYKVRE